MDARITKHAGQRIRERVGLPKQAVNKNAERALENGVGHKDVSGSISRYADKLYLQYRTANNIRFYGNQVYLFHNNVLITVIPLPQKYRKVMESIKRKGEKS